MRALIIGGGIFGVTAAIEISKAGLKTYLFESGDELINGASKINQNRFHMGYHYPRSMATAKQCLEGISSFREYFASSIIDTKENYYAISKNDSKTSYEQYIRFCNSLNLPYREKFPEEVLLNRSSVTGCIQVNEQIIQLNKLKITAVKLLNDFNVNVFLKRKFIKDDEKEYDIIVNATYSNSNIVNKLLELPLREFRYDICNVPIIELPKKMTGLGITIMDGNFHSILPYADTPYHLFWSVEESVIRKVSILPPKKIPLKIANYKNNSYIPCLQYAKLIDVLRVVKILRPDAELSDERISDLIDYGNGKYAILSAKLNTCVLTARKLVSIIKEKGRY